MASVQEFNFGNIVSTGTNAPVPQYKFDINIKWIDDNGQMQEHTGTYTWPNILSQAPNGWLKKQVLDNIIQPLAFAYLGIEPLQE